MTKADYDVMGSKTEGDEITFADVVGFFRRNWKFLGLLTVVLSAAAVALVLLMPDEVLPTQQYQNQVTLVANLAPSELLTIVERGQLPSQDQISNSALSSLKSEDFGEVEVINPRYDGGPKQITADLRAPDEDSLAGATSEMIPFLEAELLERYEGNFDEVLGLALMRTERDVENARDALDRVEQRVEQASTGGGQDDVATEGRRLASELARAGTLDRLAEAEAKQEELEQARENLPQLAAGAISVEVFSESGGELDAQQPETSSSAPLALLAVAASFVAAVALTLAREAFARRNK